MGPTKVKTLLSDFGEVTRVYLVEEDKTASKRRKKAGGSHGKRFVCSGKILDHAVMRSSIGKLILTIYHDACCNVSQKVHRGMGRVCE